MLASNQVITKFSYPSNIIQRAGLLMGLIFLLWGTSACGNIIQIVPVNTPSPVAVAQVTSTENNPTIVTNSASPPDRIIAKAIGLDASVTEMGWQVVESWNGEQISEWDLPEEKAGWHRNSARPGEGSNIVISGHNASTGGQVFANLDELQVGDEITLWNAEQKTFSYRVVDKTIVRTFAISEEADQYLRTVIEPTPREQLTLITCWPSWTNTHRLIVIAEPE